MLRSRRNLDRISRSAYASLSMARNRAVQGQMKWPSHLPCGNAFFCTFSNARGGQLASTEGIDDAEMSTETKNGDVKSARILDNSSHRDGSMYKNSHLEILCGVSNRGETQREPMMLSEPKNCVPDRERCERHIVGSMMQILSLKLAEVHHVNTSSVQLYGYIAVRDYLDSLLNYIVNRSRDNPIMAQQGSLIEITGPKRGIMMSSPVLVEFDLRIKRGEDARHDLELIDGATSYCHVATPFHPFTNRINGDCGAVDITFARVPDAVEATIDVIISEVQSAFSLSLSSFVFIGASHQEIQLFRGIIGDESCCGLTRRYVIAVELDTWIQLKFKVGQKASKYDDLESYCDFKANLHGNARDQIMLQHASISVKVTWSPLPV
ncbi:unnamed protein product [Alopecurus aequalis]